MEGMGFSLMWSTVPEFAWRDSEKLKKNVIKNGRFPGWDFNLLQPQYEVIFALFLILADWKFLIFKTSTIRSLWPSGLRCSPLIARGVAIGLFVVCYVGSGLCDELIICWEESYHVCVYVCVCLYV